MKVRAIKGKPSRDVDSMIRIINNKTSDCTLKYPVKRKLLFNILEQH